MYNILKIWHLWTLSTKQYYPTKAERIWETYNSDTHQEMKSYVAFCSNTFMQKCICFRLKVKACFGNCNTIFFYICIQVILQKLYYIQIILWSSSTSLSAKWKKIENIQMTVQGYKNPRKARLVFLSCGFIFNQSYSGGIM